MDSAIPLVAVDIGNNHTKFGLFDGPSRESRPQPLRMLRLSTTALAWQDLAAWLPDEPVQWQVGSVHRGGERQLAEWVGASRPRDSYRLWRNEHLPIAIRVDHPERVGTDRLLAAVAVNHLRTAQRPAVIVDAGSAITVDLVAADGAFEGGVILPGFRMVAEALARGTDQLPLVESEQDAPPPVVGKSTRAAILSGLFWGNVGAVRELVMRIASELATEPQVFIAGGDASKLAPHIPIAAQIVPELVFLGIVIATRNLDHQDRLSMDENESRAESS